MRLNGLDLGAGGSEDRESFARPGLILRDPETDTFADGVCLHRHKKFKKIFRKVASSVKQAVPLIVSAGGGVLNSIVPGAGSLIQGFLTRKAETLEQVGEQQVAGGIGEIVGNILNLKGTIFGTQKAEEQEIIKEQIGKEARTAESPGRATAVGVGAAAAGAGIGLAVAGPPGAAVGAVVAGGAAALGGADALDRLLFGMKG